ncbi:MAG: hypothetical protein PHU78_08675 [Heliobacteriaceae bacterium]|nr:hypothetical protein [Heliobacteriaceae bacterium]
MENKTMLQSCITNCRTAKSDIQSLSQSVQVTSAKDELNKALQSIDACINQCQTALNSL